MSKIRDLSQEKIKELYSQAVGEIGIAPRDFYAMTEEEVEWAYEGYLHRQEVTANLILLAINKGLNEDYSLISLVEEKGYTVGSKEERQRTFEILNIKE